MTVSTKIGFGKKISGEIIVLTQAADTHQVNSSFSGKILLLLSYAPREFLEKASFVGATGIILTSMHYRDFEYFKNNGDFSLLVLSKFGKLGIDKDLATKLTKLDGEKGQLDGEKKTLTI